MTTKRWWSIGETNISCEDPITTGIHSNTPDNNSYKSQTSWYYPDRVSDTAWHCMLTMLFSWDELFAFSMHINCNASLLQGIIVVIVSRQCFSPPAVFAFLMNISQPPPDIIVQSLGPRLACALSLSLLTPSSGNQELSGGEWSDDQGPGPGADTRRHRGLIEYLYWHHMGW